MRRKLIVLGIAAAALLVGGIAYASIPGPDGVIHGCYKNSNPAQGALIVVDSTASCPSGYTALDWNQTGPQGPAGANGVSGYEIVLNSVEFTTHSPGQGLGVTATCPVGKVVLGGGGDRSHNNLIFQVSRPSGQTAWVIAYRVPADDGTADPFVIEAYAICATMN